MNDFEIHRLYAILEKKRFDFNQYREDFEMNGFSASFSPIEPYFTCDLYKFKNEAINNLCITEDIGITEYYKKIVADLLNDNFTLSFSRYKPNNEIFNYLDRKSFLHDYKLANPNDKHGEGEIEYIFFCFDGFLYSYQELINSVIDYLKEILVSSIIYDEYNITREQKNKKILPKKTDMNKDKIETLIYTETKFLIEGKNKAMETDEYNRLQKDIFTMIDLQTLPSKILPYKHKKGEIKLGQLRYALYKIQNSIYHTSSRDKNFIHFILHFFPDVANGATYKTIYPKFNQPFIQPL